MKRYLMVASVMLAAFLAAPASGQTITGCGTSAIGKAEAGDATKLTLNADCFGKAKATAAAAEQARRDRIVALAPPLAAWADCAAEGGSCIVPAGTLVRYGAGGKFITRTLSGKFTCNTAIFGSDPIVGTVKACAIQGSAAAPAPSATPTPVIPPAPATGKTDALGINVASVDYYSNEYTFANLLTGQGWVDTNAGWQTVAADQIDSLGMPRSVPAGKSYAIVMTPPSTVFNGQATAVRCTWAGTGDVNIGGSRKNLTRGDHALTFDWPAAPPPEGNARNWLSLSNVGAADPVRDLDCREAALAREVTFAPQIIDSLKPFKVIRYLDWSAANQNPPSVTWANRTLPNSLNQVDRRRDGVALEHMLALAKAVEADPWFTIPWNADADYVIRMAKLVHDSLPTGRRAYVELANEPWNYAFPLSHQIQAEGLAAGLHTNGFQANIARYDQKVVETMAIWSKVFVDKPQALVRVAGSQASNPWVTEQHLANPALVAAIDAIAIAPYFNYAGDLPADADLSTRIASLQKGQNDILAKSWTALDAVRAKGKRLITYEAGQHVTDFTTGGGTRVQMVNRAPEMATLYKNYIAAWKVKVGDVMTLYSATGPAGGGGAWGIREFAGQPISETPKRAAVLGASGN